MPVKRKRGPKAAIPSLVLYVDIIEQIDRKKDNPKIRLSDFQYHRIEDENLNVNCEYEDILNVISTFLSTSILPDQENSHYELLHLPTSAIFGRSEPRPKNNKRLTNMVMPVTEDYVSNYINNNGMILDNREVRVKAGKDRKKHTASVPKKVGIDIAVVAKVVSDIPDEEELPLPPLEAINPTATKPPPKKKKKKKYLYIPRELEVHCLNPVMKIVNERECSVSYTTSCAHPIDYVTIDLEQYIEKDYDDSCGKFLFHHFYLFIDF